MRFHKHADTLLSIKNDPLGFITDSLVRLVINLIIPFPLVNETILQYKSPIVAVLLTLFVLSIFLLITIGTVIVSPFLASAGYLDKLLAPFASSTTVGSDNTFIQTTVPMQIPLGGSGLEFASITASFMDPGYFITFGTIHTGIDLVPNDSYFNNSESYKQTKKVTIYATHTGKVSHYVDSYGSETVENTSDDGLVKTVYMHMKDVYVASGTSVNAGSPIGEMGSTGRSTAEHIHYEVRVMDGNTMKAVNPLNYIR